MFDMIAKMDPARFVLAVPDDPDLVARLTAMVVAQSDPPISVGRAQAAVLTFEARTGDMMLRSRVVQALEAAVGPDWQRVVRPVD
jgi:hypothetical protein